MSIFYDLLYLIFIILYLPIFIFKKKLHRGFVMRLGILPKHLELNNPIWVHAVSVGEAMAIKGLVEKLREAYPNKKFVISTVTPTGNKIAQSIAKITDYVTYLPLDLRFIAASVIDKIKPSLFIIAETEIWPNLLYCLKKRNIPAVVVNGRISEGSFKGYRMIRFLIRPVLNWINLFCVQSGRDKERLIQLGVSENKIKITGNMKFDITDYIDFKRDYTDYRLKLGLGSDEKLLVAGSTHPGEEEIILDIYKELRLEFPNLRLLIAPRHPERSKDVEKIIIKYGFNSLRVSQLNRQTAKPLNRQTVFILDTIGQLKDFYAISDVVFVGGSLVKIGGHNILEPAIFGKPVFFGPHMFNFRDIADLFLENKVSILVRGKEELYEKIRVILGDFSQAVQISKKSKDLILQNRGATQRNLECIQRITDAKI